MRMILTVSSAHRDSTINAYTHFLPEVGSLLHQFPDPVLVGEDIAFDFRQFLGGLLRWVWIGSDCV